MISLIRVCGRDVRAEGRLPRIAFLEGERYKSLNDPEPLLQGLRKHALRIDLFTFRQRLPETSPKYNYPMEWDNLAVLPVSTFDHWWTKQVDNKTRNMVRKSGKKGVILREVALDDFLVRGIWGIYNETPVRQGKRYPHYGEDIDTVYKETATFLDRSIFIGAFFGEELIGFVKLVYDETRTQANLVNIISMVRHRDKAPTNALIAYAVRSCAERGVSYLVYTKFAYGKKKRDGLSDFKERNGFQRIDLPRYYVPLTRIGWAAFRLGLHHRFVDNLPEPVIARFRGLRNAWYNRKLPRVIEAP